MTGQVIKAWISKYALTTGILEVEGHVVKDVKDVPSMFLRNNSYYSQYYHNNDWHLSREEAVEDAKIRKQRKLSSLRRQLARIEKLTFEEG